MFGVVTGRRRRRISNPRTIAVSVAAHVLLFGGVALASAADRRAPELADIIDIGPVPEEAKPEPPKTPEPPRPEPVRPDEPPRVEGTTRELPAPVDVPPDIPPVNPAEDPVDPSEFSGKGPIGNVIVENPVRTGETVVPAEPGNGAEVFDVGTVEVRPDFQNRAEIGRLLRRSYPPLLLDAGVEGRVVIEMVVNAEGRVEPGSVTVVSATHPGFADASIRVAEKMRFAPARIGDQRVAVRVTLPVDWDIER